MTKLRRYSLWGVIVAAFVLIVLWEAFPLADAKSRLDSLPLRGETFDGQTLPLSDMEVTVFEGCNLIKRIYRVGSDRMFLTIVDGTNNRNAVHDPTLCFSGSGWEVSERERLEVDGGYAEIITLKKGIRRREVLLWFSEGDRKYGSVVTYWYRTALRRLTMGLSGNEPVRIIVELNRPGININWKEIMNQFPELFEV